MSGAEKYSYQKSPAELALERVRGFMIVTLVNLDCAEDIQYIVEEFRKERARCDYDIAVTAWCKHPFFCANWLRTFANGSRGLWLDTMSFHYSLTDLGERADGRVGVRIHCRALDSAGE